MAIKVVVSGAAGKMGQEVVKAVHQASDMVLVGAFDRQRTGEDAGTAAGVGFIGVEIQDDLTEVLTNSKAHIMVDFTEPGSVLENVFTALHLGVRVVVGTTGLSQVELEEIETLSLEKDLGAVVAPNFAIGAVLMMYLAQQAASWVPHVEIIELHHERKKDAPSGTALKTAEMIKEAWSDLETASADIPMDEWESLPGARGGNLEGIHIHSVRLPGFVAHQEVIFGLAGQTLTLRHDSINRESFMPGVLMAIREVVQITGLIYGLEHLLF